MSQAGTAGTSTPGFITTTLRLCAGTKVLTEIYDSSPARAIWRFFMLTILCSILAAVVGTLVQRGAFERAGKALDEEIGAIVVTPEKVVFEKDPDVPRRFRLPYITLEYYPGNTFDSEDFNAGRTSDFGIVILPGGLASWSMVDWKDEDIFSATILPASSVYAMWAGGVDDKASQKLLNSPWAFYSGQGLAESLKKEIGAPLPTREPAPDAETPAPEPLKVTGSQLGAGALSVLTAIVLLKTFGRNLLEIGLIVFLVSLVQYLRASTLPKGFAFRNVLTIMVYSTFPAQIFATLFDAAGGGRFIPFQLLFVCVFFFYQLFAFRAVLRKIDPQMGRNDRDGFDDDF